ncbi:MAG TPA: ABC transporter permease [Longimicrobiales bacterium]|nr:ABC transporter permease [Longimicrobiales bacterium]
MVLHVLAESLTLALYGALLGGALGWAGVSAIAYGMSNVGGGTVPYWMQFKVDGPVLVFAALAAAASGIVAGLFPALRATSGDVAPLLKDGSRGTTGLRIGRLSRALVGVEVAFSVAVLVAAGLMYKSVTELARFDLPFDPERVLAAQVDLFADGDDDPLRRVDLLHEALERARELPGVEGAALASTVPGWSASQATTEVEGSEYAAGQEAPLARVMAVSPDFFELLGVDPVAGRTFATLDERGELPVAVVNESFALAHFREGDPIGRRVRIDVQAEDPDAWRTVVGVVPDLLMQGLVNVGGLGGAGLYVPTTQSDDWAATLLARTEGAPLALRDDLQELLRSVDPDLGIIGVGTLTQRIGEPAWYIRMAAWIFVAFGLIALFLACVGLTGVVAFESERRTQEVGVRMALGAKARDVAGLIVGHGVRQVGLGIVAGLVLAAGLSRGLVIVLFETDPNDPLLYLGAAGIVLVVAALASLYPALRAAHSDPVKSLRAR